SILSGIIAALTPHRRKKLKIINEDNAPVAFAKISFIDPVTNKIKMVHSDLAGRVGLGKVTGDLEISIEKKGYEILKATIQVTTNDSSQVELLLRFANNQKDVITQMPFQVVLPFDPSLLVAG